MDSLHKKIISISSKVDSIEIHLKYIKQAVNEIRADHKSLNRFKNMTYGICAFLTITLPLIVVSR